MNPPTHQILYIDRNTKNAELLQKALSKFNFAIYHAANYKTIDTVLQSINFDIALMDISGFDSRIWDRCKAIRAQNIPLLILSGQPEGKIQQLGIKNGASGIIAKPLILKDFIQIIQSPINHET